MADTGDIKEIEIKDIKRLNYFTGQFLEAQDFQAEQRYYIDMRRRLNKTLYTPGVVDGGFEVTKIGDKRIKVGAGFAIDKDGCELIITGKEEDPKTVEKDIGGTGDIYVALRYAYKGEDKSSFKTGTEGEGANDTYTNYIRIAERPEIRLLSNLPTGDDVGVDILIAKIQLDASGNIQSIVTSDRLMANLKIGSRKLGIGTNTDPKFALSVAGAVAIGTNFANLPITENSLNVEGNIIGKNLSLAADNEKRGALFFTSPGLYNHAVYNNNSNVDGEGKWDGIKFNTGSGINIRTGSPQNYVSTLYIKGGPLVGINTTDPKSHLSVAGGLSVGGTYAKTNAAPANGLLVEGNVGIGTTNPRAALSFNNVDNNYDDILGITWYNDNIENYGIYRTKGNWSSPDYQQLQLKWLTGIVLNPGTDYGKSYVDIQGNGLRVTAGKVGIGTTEPKSILSVAGGLAVGSTYAKTYAAPANGLLVEGKVGIGTREPGVFQMNVVGTTRLGGVKDYSTDTLLSIAPGTIQFDANDMPGGRLTIKGNTGNVGIGTSSPGARLEVAGTLTATQNNETLIGLKLAPTFQNGGKTGIKCCTLDVDGVANTENQISLQVKSGNTADQYGSNQITFGYNNTAQYRHALKTRHNSQQRAGNAIDFYVWNYSTEIGAADKIGGLHTLTLDGGNVGIGTTNPGDYKLNVVGQALFSEGINTNKIQNNKAVLTFHSDGDLSIGQALDRRPAKFNVDGCISEKLELIVTKNDGNWTSPAHPIKKFFGSRLAGKPVGTMIKAITDHKDWRGHFWIGWVDADSNIRVIHNYLNTREIATFVD